MEPWAKIHRPNTSSDAVNFDGELVEMPEEHPFTQEDFERLKALPGKAPDEPRKEDETL